MFKKVSPATFSAIVAITLAGDEETGLIDAQFKNLRRSEFNALMDEARDSKQADADLVMALLDGWNHEHPDSLVTAPFSREVVDALVDEYWTAVGDFVRAFVKAKTEAKQKN